MAVTASEIQTIIHFQVLWAAHLLPGRYQKVKDGGHTLVCQRPQSGFLAPFVSQGNQVVLVGMVLQVERTLEIQLLDIIHRLAGQHRVRRIGRFLRLALRDPACSLQPAMDRAGGRERRNTEFVKLIIDRLGTQECLLVLRSLPCFSFLPDLDHHLLDPFWIAGPPLLRYSRVILQAPGGSLHTVSFDPPIYPGTRTLQGSGNLTFLPALQMQGNGSFAQLDFTFHRSTSWFSLQKV